MSTHVPTESIRWTFDRVNLCLFILFISAPLVVMVIPGLQGSGGVSDEKRVPAPLPRLGFSHQLITAFPEQFDGYLEDHFGLRRQLVRWHSQLYCRGLRMSSSPKVVMGDEPWLYFNGDPATDDLGPVVDYRGTHPLELHVLERLRYMYQDQHDWLSTHGMRYMLVLVPSKTGIYPEYLPDSITRSGAPRWREQLLGHLQAHTDVKVVDVTPAILAAKERGRMFLHTDTHWSEYGGFIAHQEIIQALRPWFSQLEPMPESAYEMVVNETEGGDLAGILSLPDVFREEHRVPRPRVQPKGQRAARSESEKANVFGGTGDPGHPTAYVYRDSFAEYLVPYLTEYFREIEYEWGQRGSHMKGIEQRSPDVVLQIVGDRALRFPSIRFAPRMQRAAAIRRFEGAPRLIRTLTPEGGYDGLRPDRSCTLSHHPEALVVHAPEGGARLTLPAIEDADTDLAIIRFEIRPPAYSTLQVFARTDSAVPWRKGEEIGLGRDPLEQGRNIIYLQVVDPRPMDDLVLDLGPAHGDYGIYSIEIRALPRYPQQAPRAGSPVHGDPPHTPAGARG